MPGNARYKRTTDSHDMLSRRRERTRSPGADDGTRTRDPHLGKKMVMRNVHRVRGVRLARQSLRAAPWIP